MAFTDQELEEQMMAEAQRAVKALLAQRPSSDEITLTEIEGLVRRTGEKIMEEMTASLVEASQDTQQVPGPACPQCGQEMVYKGHKEKKLTTETGKARVRRAYYYCHACAVGLFPLDKRRQLNGSQFSDALSREMVWLRGLVPSFRQAHQVFQRIGHLGIFCSNLWRSTQAHGQQMKRQVDYQQVRVAPERILLPSTAHDPRSMQRH